MSRTLNGLMLGSIELFCKTAELQSFTAAAAHAGITQAAVSRAVSRLEARVGVQLFVRSTRSVRLTERGQTYYEQCRQALGQLTEAERELTGQQDVVAGQVRISLPTSYGHLRVLPVLAEFRRRYPHVKLEIQLTNRNVDLVAEGIDIAIRARNLPDSGLVTRKLEDAELVIVASPDYLAQHRIPAAPEELLQHECIQFKRPLTGQVIPWLLQKDSELVEVHTSGAVCITDDVLGLATAARAGLGLAQTYRYIVADDLVRGTLIEVLSDYAKASRPFSVLYSPHRNMPVRVRVLIEFLVERFQQNRHERV